jgi:hypothetical protein
MNRSYNAENEIVTAAGVTYTYDGAGTRLSNLSLGAIFNTLSQFAKSKKGDLGQASSR